MHSSCIVVVALAVLLNQTICKEYCIVPSLESNQIQDNSSCSTLDQFAVNDHTNDSDVTLILQPGHHGLDADIWILNLHQFELTTNGSASSAITCTYRGRIIVENVSNVSITNVDLVGCEGNVFKRVSLLVFEDSAFRGSNRSSTTSLIIIDVIFVNISNGIFSSNGYIQQNQVVGTSITVSRSVISIQDSLFQNNLASFFGLINASMSRINITRCEFIDNKGGIVFANLSTVFITESKFQRNTELAISRLLTLLLCQFEAHSTNFTENSNIMIGVGNDLSLTDCQFHNNFVPDANAFTEASIFDVDYEGILLLQSSNVTMSSCSFSGNKAKKSGGIVVLQNVTALAKLNLEVANNIAFEGAFVMIKCDNVTFSGETVFKNNVGSLSVLESELFLEGTVIFSNNTGSSRGRDIIRGGAITVYFGRLHFLAATAIFKNNRGVNGGALYATSSSILNFDTELNVTNNTADSFGGGVFLYQSTFSVNFDTFIASNEARIGGGIYTVSSTIIVTSLSQSTFHSLTISRNSAMQGGGIYFSTSAHIYVYQIDPRPHKLTVSLTMNSAETGGALYIRDETIIPVCETGSANSAESPSTTECFFQVVDLYTDKGNLSLEFDSNTARSSGSVLFGGLLDRCIVTPLIASSFFDTAIGTPVSQIDGLTYFLSISDIRNTSSLASDPVRVCFCFGGRHNCNKTQIDVYPQKGQKFNVSVAALDHVGHSLSATVFTELQSSTGGLGEGQLSQVVDDVCTDLEFSVTSSTSKETIMIFANGPCGSAQRSTREISVTFTNCSCPIGFSVDRQEMSSCECVCNKQIERYIESCTIERESFIKSGNFWIDYDNNTGYSVGSSCPLDYCLPFASTSINLNQFDGANQQCASNRAGKLCGGCQQDHSLSLGQSGCIVCGRLWPINTVVYALVVLTFGAVLMGVILFLNLTVAVGTLNGFIFAANILKAVFPFPRKHYPTYVISFLNLDLGFGVDFCFYDGLSTYAKTWFELILPIYLHVLVALVIIACNYSSRFANYIGKRNPVETLVTLLFLSYSKLLQFIISVFASGRITHPDGSEELVWLLDGRIGYNDPKHIAMIVVALVVIVIVFVYTFLLLFWQWLVKCPKWKVLSLLRNTKLIKAIEFYHVPFNATHRYWTGLLLLIRFIVYIVATSTSSESTSSETYFTIALLLTCLLVIKSLKVRVYKKLLVDVLESTLISLTIIATAAVASSTSNQASLVTVIILTLIVTSLLVIVIIYHFKTYVFKKRNIPNILSTVTETLRGGFIQSTTSTSGSDCNTDVQRQHNAVYEIDYPRTLNYLNVDRFGTILDVLDPPTDSDYRQHSSLETSTSSDQYSPDPVSPTSTVVQGPI